MRKSKYTGDQRQQIKNIIDSSLKQKKGWNEIADAVNAANIITKKYESRGLYKTWFSWQKSKNKAALFKTEPNTLPVKTTTTLAPRVKRSYTRRTPTRRSPEIQVLNVPEARHTNDTVILMVVRAGNIRSVLEQIQ